jgi:hypothetical protein
MVCHGPSTVYSYSTTDITTGIHQTNTAYSDGVPGLSQRSIQPNSTFVYKWAADTYGSYFYHAHSRGQIDDGAYGPITIRPRPDQPKPFHMIGEAKYEDLEAAELIIQPLMLTDWRHRTSEETWNDQVRSGVENAVCMDSVLVNGRGAVECLQREDIDALVDYGIAPMLKTNGLKLTNKGYDIKPSSGPTALLTTIAVFHHNSSRFYLAMAHRRSTSRPFLRQCSTYARLVSALARSSKHHSTRTG